MTLEQIKTANAEELQARLADLDLEEHPEKREALTDEEIGAMAEEIPAIEARLAELREQAEAEKRACEDAANNGKTTRTFEEEKKMEKNFAVDSQEYRIAYLKNLMGKELDEEERAALTQAGAVIPTEMQNKVWEKLRENPLIAELDPLHIHGYVTLPREKTTNDASWLAMATESTDSADEVDSVTLGAKKLIKTIEIGADMQAMSIPAFQTWLTKKLVEKMEAAICAAVISGAGSATVPQGVMANAAGATAVTKAFTLAGLSAAMGSLPAAYHKNAIWVMDTATFYTVIVPLAADSNGMLVMNGLEKRLLGHKVVLDDTVNGKAIFGDFYNGYAFNFASDIEIKADTSVGFRAGSTVYRSLALADGAVVQGEAFVVVTKAA